MEQEFVTLPREVVEQAVEALFCTDSEEGSTAYKNELEAVKKLRAALEQPQANQPAMTPIAQRKLEDLVASGYTISGYSIYHKQKHQHGFVTGAGLVGWWKPEGVEHVQPHVEQEPVAWLKTWNSVGHARTGMQRLDLTPECETWLANMFPTITPLYTHQQPKREPLTDEQILGFGPGQEDAEWTYEDQLYFARAIENAHNIK